LSLKLFLDTNALLNLGVHAFNEEFVISQVTLQEIEKIKTSRSKDNDIKYKARCVARLLDQNCGKYTVVPYDKDVAEFVTDKFCDVTPDNIILASAYLYGDDVEPILMCTDDINCKFIAKNIFYLDTKSTEELNIVKEMDDYHGYVDVTFSDLEMSDFYRTMDVNHFDLLDNEYLIIRKSDGEIVDTLRWFGGEYKKVVNRTIRSTFFGDKIRPKDVYQSCAIDSIVNNTMTMLSGKAGSGKTLISLATIMSLIDSGEYDRVVIMFNPTKVRGASDMGYYTGNATEKAMQNNIGGILTTKFGDRFAVDMLLQQEKLRLVSMADIRGMEVRDNEILYITEAQNTSVDMLRLCLSRASDKCKIIVEGDYYSQVDSYLYDDKKNGMRRTIQMFKGEDVFGYVHLPNVWRSKIATLAEKL